MKIGIVSDIHGNHYALEQVLNSAKEEGVTKLLVLGDIVGYYYHPDKVMDMLEEWDYELIKGNHEEILESLILKQINPESIKNKYGSGHNFALENLSKKQISTLITAPHKKELCINGVNIVMCHGTTWSTNFYLYPDTQTEILARCDEKDFDFVVVGHSHYSFVYRNAHSMLINVGSVGQSRSTGGMASWCIINTMNKSFELKSTKYDTLLLELETQRIIIAGKRERRLK